MTLLTTEGLKSDLWSVLLITMSRPLDLKSLKFGMFLIFLNINSSSYSFQTIASQYSEYFWYFEKYSDRRCKQSICLHYGVYPPFAYFNIIWQRLQNKILNTMNTNLTPHKDSMLSVECISQWQIFDKGMIAKGSMHGASRCNTS